MTVTSVKKITVDLHVGKIKDLPREELCLELGVDSVVQRSPSLVVTKKVTFDHTFTCDVEYGQVLTLSIIRFHDQSVYGTVQMTFDDIAVASGKTSVTFNDAENTVAHAELDITVMARVHSGLLDSSIDFLASPLPWFLKAEDIYNLAKRGVTYAHGLPYSEHVVDSLESLSEALLQRTALIHPDEGSSCLTALDELVAHTLSTADERVDQGRMRVITSVRGVISAIERNVAEQRQRVNTIATDLHSEVSTRVTTTLSLTREKMMSTLALYEERYPDLAQKAKAIISQAQTVAAGAQQMLGSYTETVSAYYCSTRQTVGQAYSGTQAVVQRCYDATVGAAYATVTDTVIKAPGLACSTLDQGTELVKDVPIVGAYAAPCMSTAAGMIRYFTNSIPTATGERTGDE